VRKSTSVDDGLNVRLRLCERFSFFLALLHNHNVVFGDISSRNTLYSLHPKPSVMFVDCDGVRIAGNAAVVKQLHTPDWDPPEAEAAWRIGRSPPQSKATDSYKLALFILRVLAPGTGASVNRDPEAAAHVIDSAGQQLLQRALKGSSRDRPSAKEWHSYFTVTLESMQRDPGSEGSVPIDAPSDRLFHTERLSVEDRPGWIRGSDGSWKRAEGRDPS
jgi:hypothetical protein